MDNTLYRALVVDDEPVVRGVVIYALMQQGFVCDFAIDGADAMQKLSQKQYDLVVTDILMPKRHGHALSTFLLERREEGLPVVVVHTGVENPLLTKDLLIRGVDDVVYKPTNYDLFAAKVRALVMRQHARQSLQAKKVSAEAFTDAVRKSAPSAAQQREGMSLEELDHRLAQVHHLLPVSDVAVEVVHRADSEDCDVRTLADLIQRDVVLATELLRLVNSGFYNRGGRKVVELQEAVARVGVKRIGEIALALSSLKGMAKIVLPWFDRDLTRARSLAGCLIADRLLKGTTDRRISSGVVFSALLYPLARMVVASAVPHLYERILQECEQTGVAVDVLEQRLLPCSLTELLVRLISRWGLPSELYAPLAQMHVSKAERADWPEALRQAVALLQQAVCLGEFVVGRWLPWETVDAPRASELPQLEADSAGRIVENVRSELSNIISTSAASSGPSPTGKSKRLYCRLGETGYDFVRLLIASTGMALQDVATSVRSLPSGTLVNALDAPADELAFIQESAAERGWTVWMRADQVASPPSPIPAEGPFLYWPTSYRAMSASLAQGSP